MSHRDVMGNVAYGLEVRGMGKAEREQKGTLRFVARSPGLESAELEIKVVR